MGKTGSKDVISITQGNGTITYIQHSKNIVKSHFSV